MAESPAHKFGQIIGKIIEDVIYPLLREFADEYNYYVDKAGIRGRARLGKIVRWQDKYGNDHELDFVIEEGGTENIRGRPLAFIEAAWRRYTKHSRNKAQEIQGAVLPIAEYYSRDSPFLGAIIAGNFTEGSIRQLKSVGFDVLYFPYETIVAAFHVVGIHARFDEDTSDKDFRKCVDEIEKLPTSQRNQIKQELKRLNQKDISVFIEKLRNDLSRTIKKILVCPLFGSSSEFSTVDEAITFLGSDFKAADRKDFRKIEIVVVYSNADRIEGSFMTPEKAVDFLEYARK